ncbi:MAG: acyltransferase [Bacteroidetes bacterium]|nr:acyltransferase [Bacteroidota bacterium]
MNGPNNGIPILDNLRAIAAWAVCLFHFVCTTTGFIDPGSFVYRFFSFGKYGVHLFFIISGLVIPWSMYNSNYQIKNFFRFFFKRLIRLEPPYIISIILMLCILFLRKYSPAYDGKEVNISIRQVIFHVGYLIPFFKDVTWLTNVYWTLAIEFQYYLLIGVFYFLFYSKRRYVRIVAYLVFVISPVVFSTHSFLPFWLPLFGIGILLFSYKKNIIPVIEFIIATILFLSVLYFFNDFIVFLVALISAAAILFLFHYSIKRIAWLGAFSYSVYLMHSVLGAAVVNTLSHYAHTPAAKVLVVLSGIITTFISSYIMYFFVEKPSKKISSTFTYKKNAE